MLAGVYSLQIQGRFRDDPHPHVVVVELAKECYAVPAFSVDGVEVQDLIRDRKNLEVMRDDQIYVQLDNAIHVSWERPGYTGKLAYWLVSQPKRLSKTDFGTHNRLGQMKPEGFQAIVQGVLNYADAKPDLFSKPVLKKLRKSLRKPAP